MSEVREVYNVTLQPGRLLDAQVAQVMGRLSDKVLAELKQRGVGVPDEKDMDGRYIGSSPWENVLRYSTDPAAAMEAWAWLEENHPWVEQGNDWPWQQGIKAAILLGKDYIGQEDNPRPSVLVMQRAEWWSFPDNEIEEGTKEGYCFYIPGDTYPHAIALAVAEAGKIIGGPNESA